MALDFFTDVSVEARQLVLGDRKGGGQGMGAHNDSPNTPELTFHWALHQALSSKPSQLRLTSFLGYRVFHYLEVLGG